MPPPSNGTRPSKIIATVLADSFQIGAAALTLALSMNPIANGVSRLFWGQAFDQAVHLRDLEADHPEVKADVVGGEETLQLLGQYLLIPAGVQGELVVSDNIGPFLSLGHVLDPETGHRLHPNALCGLDPTVSGEDRAGLVNQDGVGESERSDGVRDLAELFLRVGSRVLRPGPQRGRVELFDMLGHGGSILEPKVKHAVTRRTSPIFMHPPTLIVKGSSPVA